MLNVKTSIFLILLVLITAASGTAMQLRESHFIDKNGAAQYYGLSSGKIIEFDGRKLIFYNRHFKPAFEYDLSENQSAVITENGYYYAIIEDMEISDTISEKSVTVYNSRRQPVWGTIVDGQPDLYLSPGGNFFVAVYGTSGYYDFSIKIYHKDFPPVGRDVEACFDIEFSKEGERFIIDAGLKGTYLFAENGDLILKLEPQKYYCFGDARNSSAFYAEGIIGVYRDSSLVWSYDIKKPIIYGFALVEDADQVIIAFNNSLAAIGMAEDSILYGYPTGLEGGNYTGIDISGDNRLIACGVDVNKGTLALKEGRHTQGFLFVYDIKGTTFSKIDFNYSRYAKGIPRVYFMSDNRSVAVETVEKIHIVEIF